MNKTQDEPKALWPSMGLNKVPPEHFLERWQVAMLGLERAMAMMGYFPLGYINTTAFTRRLERELSAHTDLVGRVSEDIVLEMLPLVVEKEHLPAAFDTYYEELVDAASGLLSCFLRAKILESESAEQAEESLAARRQPKSS